MAKRLHVVTNSELGTWRTCPQRWDFSYRQRLRPIAPSRPMRIGDAWHEGVAKGIEVGHAFATSSKSDDTNWAFHAQLLAATQGADAAIARYAESVRASLDDPRLPPGESESLLGEQEEAEALLRWMVPHYFRATQNDFAALVPIAVEQSFEVPVMTAAGRPTSVRLAGKWDAIYFDTVNGDILLEDHKSTAEPLANFERRVEMDPQMSGYLWAVMYQQARGELSAPGIDRAQLMAAPVGRIRYNIMRRKAPSVPKTNKDGALSVAACDTTADIFEAALAATARTPEPKHLEILEALRAKGDPFFRRLEHWQGPDDLERWRKEILVDAGRIREGERKPEARTRNPGACTGPGSFPCSYRAICLQPNSAEIRATYREAAVKHEELETHGTND